MKISKNSWHYKLLDFFKFDVIYDLRLGINVSLCRYFWNVVVGLMAVGGCVVLGSAAVFLIGALTFLAVIAPISYLTQSYFGFGWDYASTHGVSMIWIMWVVLPLAVGITGAFKGELKVFPSWMKVNNKPRIKKAKKPNIFMEYLKAKKAKVCPLVEVSDE